LAIYGWALGNCEKLEGYYRVDVYDSIYLELRQNIIAADQP